MASTGRKWPWTCTLKSLDQLALEQRLLWLCRPMWEWQSLPQWLHLKVASAGGAGLSLAGAATSIIFVITKVLSWQNMSFVMTKVCLSQPNYVCRNKIFLSWQKFCCGRHTFVATEDMFCHDKRRVFGATKVSLSQQIFVITKLLSQQTYFCWDKHTFVMTKDVFCSNKHVWRNKHVFVMTKTLLQQKWYLWQLPPVILVGCSGVSLLVHLTQTVAPLPLCAGCSLVPVFSGNDLDDVVKNSTLYLIKYLITGWNMSEQIMKHNTLDYIMKQPAQTTDLISKSNIWK